MMATHSTFKPFSPSYDYRPIALKARDFTQNGYWADKKRCGRSLKPVSELQGFLNSETERDDGLWCRRTKFFAKKISHRVTSGHAHRRIGVNPVFCDRREKFGDEKFSRHYCELFGPDLCKDCSKNFVQTDLLSEYHAADYTNKVSVDPFTIFVRWNSNKEDYHSEESSDDESDIFINELADNEELTASENPSPTLQNKVWQDIPSTPAQDSGIDSCSSSRLGRIRSLVNTENFPRYKDLSRQNTAFCGEYVRRRENRIPTSRESTALGDRGRGNTGRLLKDMRAPSSNTNTSPVRRVSVNRHLMSSHAKSLAALYSYGYPLKSKKDWVKLPVQPILMDLKLINFTSYDKSFCTLATGVGLEGIDGN